MFFSRLSFRIGLWYALAFFLSSILLFLLTGYLLLSSVQKKDEELLSHKVEEYSRLFAHDGVRGLEERTSSRETRDSYDFVVRLSDAHGKTIFIYSPDRSSDPDAPTLAELDDQMRHFTGKNQWSLVRGRGFGDDVEVVSRVLPSGETLQVGKDTEDREDFLNSFTRAYLAGLLPILLIAILIGLLLSKRLLEPIRSLTQTVISIRDGRAKARVPLHTARDELWNLGKLFNEMLELNDRLLTGMHDTVDNVAHDLRTPIMRLQNSIEEALRGNAEVERFRDALLECQENSLTLLKLVNAIMDIAEAEAGTLVLHRERLYAVQLIERAVDLYAFVAEDRGITITTDYRENFNFMGDPVRCLQALSNILDNAIKYSPDGSEINVSSFLDGDQGIIAVRDQGIGIPELEIKRIWTRLYRVDSSRSSRGLGLGLSVVKAIMQAHLGDVSVTSKSGKGSEFLIRFPLAICSFEGPEHLK